jgi:hypothetical protein
VQRTPGFFVRCTPIICVCRWQWRSMTTK